ncbi:hypothetical protein [Chitinimonas koreensis]|uniref:hypothetical protein n=1 Tax=Chitinimonas koreensis TaxID=356302 RepID=UPI0004071AD4|nr:hypothetical protein [Chitinimonas koreensis]QNM95536.1 hypothetical protein H9L41_16920 [Chitinimonas koreensis]
MNVTMHFNAINMDDFTDRPVSEALEHLVAQRQPIAGMATLDAGGQPIGALVLIVGPTTGEHLAALKIDLSAPSKSA